MAQRVPSVLTALIGGAVTASVVFAPGCGLFSSETPPAPLEVAHARAVVASERIRDELDCVSSIARYLCPVASLSAAVAPGVDLALLGLTVTVRPGRPIEGGAMESVGVSVLQLEGGQARMAGIQASTQEEQNELLTLIANLSMVLKGKEERVYPSPALETFLTEPASPDREIEVDAIGAGFIGDQPTRLYRVPDTGTGTDVLVAVEAAPGGTFLSVFPIVDDGGR